MLTDSVCGSKGVSFRKAVFRERERIYIRSSQSRLLGMWLVAHVPQAIPLICSACSCILFVLLSSARYNKECIHLYIHVLVHSLLGDCINRTSTHSWAQHYFCLPPSCGHRPQYTSTSHHASMASCPSASAHPIVPSVASSCFADQQ